MRNLLLSILITTFILQSCGGELDYNIGKKNKNRKGYYPTGELWWEYSYLNGVGFYESYYENGRPSRRGSYSNGEINGVWEFYHQNGQLERKGSYENGVRIGIWEYYNEDGSLEGTETY